MYDIKKSKYLVEEVEFMYNVGIFMYVFVRIIIIRYCSIFIKNDCNIKVVMNSIIVVYLKYFDN